MGDYNLDSIQKLNFFDAVRKYPGMYIGSKDTDGLHHLINEILSNSIDEYLNGNCTKIDVTLYDSNTICISDNGRGIPIGEKTDDKTALELCFTEEHAGGKFLNDTGDSGYNTSGGMHGLGTKCVNALSSFLQVTSAREGKKETIKFINGVKSFHNISNIEDDVQTGLTVFFKPSGRYLEDTNFNSERIKTMLQEFSFLCKGLNFTFKNEKTEEIVSYSSSNGLYDYLEYLNKDKEFLCKPIYFEKSRDTFGVEIAFGYNDSYTSNIKLYTNNIPQNKGTHLTGFKTAFTSCLNFFAREKKWLKEKDDNLQGTDFEEGLLLIINFKMIDPVFKGQNKEELSSSEGRTYVQSFSNEALKELFPVYEKEIKKIVDKAVSAKKAREAAKKARDASRRKRENKALGFDSKLADCYSKDRSKCEIFVVEGDSAAGNLKLARDNEFQAVLPVRGKILNCAKATIEQIQKNAEIMTMIDAFGLGIGMGLKTMKVTYNPDELRYDKIIIMSDGDIDGSHIKNLFYTFIWKFCPQLILDGHIYAGVPPLFKITHSKGYTYLKDEGALKEYSNTHKGQKYSVNRLKGLGEMDVTETEETLTDPKNRILRQITVEDIESTNKLFEDLMGTKVIPRKEYIQIHSKEATYVI